MTYSEELKLYVDETRDLVIVYEPHYGRRDNLQRLRIAKCPQKLIGLGTWNTVKTGEYLGRREFDNQISWLYKLEIVFSPEPLLIERAMINDPDEDIYENYMRVNGRLLSDDLCLCSPHREQAVEKVAIATMKAINTRAPTKVVLPERGYSSIESFL